MRFRWGALARLARSRPGPRPLPLRGRCSRLYTLAGARVRTVKQCPELTRGMTNASRAWKCTTGCSSRYSHRPSWSRARRTPKHWRCSRDELTKGADAQSLATILLDGVAVTRPPLLAQDSTCMSNKRWWRWTRWQRWRVWSTAAAAGSAWARYRALACCRALEATLQQARSCRCRCQWHALHRYVRAPRRGRASSKFGVNYDLLANLGKILLFYFQALCSSRASAPRGRRSSCASWHALTGWLDLNISIYPRVHGLRLRLTPRRARPPCRSPPGARCWLLSCRRLYAVNRYKRVAADAASEPGMRATAHAAQSRRYGREARREGHDGAGSGGARGRGR